MVTSLVFIQKCIAILEPIFWQYITKIKGYFLNKSIQNMRLPLDYDF